MVRKLRKRDIERLENTSPFGPVQGDVAAATVVDCPIDCGGGQSICAVSESCIVVETDGCGLSMTEAAELKKG